MSALVEALQLVAGLLLIVSVGGWVLAFAAGVLLVAAAWFIGKK